ncbi:hypothetical protein GGR54DRAFT_37143 [Hypoxylon sp. NC1633]|nr:hypothetical protein GGR54DRAFT_37143 [Hypoxylon sp. NC1633]
MDTPKLRRSRTGCVTCRGRKVRCDEQHPVCHACTRLRLNCRYFSEEETAQLTRKTSRARQAKYRVRFVEANGTQGQTSEPDSRKSHPTTPSTPSSRDGLIPSPASSNPSMASPQTVGQGEADFGALSRLPFSPSWSGEGSQQAVEADASLNLDLSNPQYDDNAGDMMVPDDIEKMLDSINFPTDIGLLWDSMPAMGDFDVGFRDRPTSIDERTNNEVFASMGVAPSPAPSRAPEMGETVTIRPEDQEPLQHYLSTMVKFAKIRSSASDNIYCYIFTNMGLTHQPLYEAILAWAALHLAHVRSSPASDAGDRYQRAAGLLYDDVRAAEHVDLTLVTVWILLQYELFAARGVDRFIRLLNYAADVVEGVFEHNHIDDVKEQLGSIGLRVFMWLSAYDGRAAPFGHSCRLLRCLKLHSSIYNVVDSRSRGQVGHPIEFGTAESKACLRLALRLNIIRGSCILLGRWQADSMEQESAWATLQSSFQSVWQEIEESSVPASKLSTRVANGEMDVPITANPLEYNWMQLLATYYSNAILYLHHYPGSRADSQDQETGLPPLPSAEECAARIIRLSRHVSLSHPNSPQAIWPPTLFQAGVVADDPIYQSWVLAAFAQAEAWGPNLRRTRLLLERIVKYPKEVRLRLDITTLMDDLGGPFVV